MTIQTTQCISHFSSGWTVTVTHQTTNFQSLLRHLDTTKTHHNTAFHPTVPPLTTLSSTTKVAPAKSQRIYSKVLSRFKLYYVLILFFSLCIYVVVVVLFFESNIHYVISKQYCKYSLTVVFVTFIALRFRMLELGFSWIRVEHI